MSPTWEQRLERWRDWHRTHQAAGWEIAAFEHWDSSATAYDGPNSDIVCAGCRFEIKDPMRECTPLYRRER